MSEMCIRWTMSGPEMQAWRRCCSMWLEPTANGGCRGWNRSGSWKAGFSVPRDEEHRCRGPLFLSQFQNLVIVAVRLHGVVELMQKLMPVAGQEVDAADASLL